MEPDVLEIDFDHHVLTWRRGDPTVKVWTARNYAPHMPLAEPDQELSVPPGSDFTQQTLDRFGHALFDEQATDEHGEPDTADYRRRADLLNRAAFAAPVDPDRDGLSTPSLTVAGVAVHLYLAPDSRRYVVGIHFDDVPDWLLDDDGTVPITVRMNGQAIA